MLDYLGDLGGLVNALNKSFAILVAPLATFAVNKVVFHSIFDGASKKRRSFSGPTELGRLP